MSKIQKNQSYQVLIDLIDETYRKGQHQAVSAVQRQLVVTHWEIGRHIVEYEQGGKETSEFGSNLLEQLSAHLSLAHGKGFSRSNLSYMRQFYIKYPNRETLSHNLNWSHYFELLKVENDLERSFYEKQALLEKWNVRELRRQKKAALFLRLAATTDKKGLLKLLKYAYEVNYTLLCQ